MAVYLDTGAMIALYEARDQFHARAVEAYRSLAKAGELLVTGTHTLTEFADGLVRHYDQRTAVAQVEDYRASRHVKIVDSNEAWTDALALFSKHKDWEIDLSDALSFAVMKRQGIRRAFTFDADFLKAGFEMQPGTT